MKFKSVDIVGFRAYAEEGDGAFNFTNSDGEISNFVSIYAPNGFGKSSFYDAMEWAITNNIGRYIRDSQRTNNDSASLYLNTSESSQRILKNRYIDDKAPSYVKVRTTLSKDFDRTVRRPAPGQRDYTYDPTRTDKTTKHLVDIFLSQDAIDSFLKEERPEQRYDRFMGAFGGSDEKYRSALFTSIKSCSKELKQLNDTISSLEENLSEPTLEFSIDEVNKTIEEMNRNGASFPLIGTSFSELDQTALLSTLSKRVVELNTELTSLSQQSLAIDYCLGNLPQLNQYRDHRSKIKADLAKINENREDISTLSKAIDTKTNLEQRVRGILDEIKLISHVTSNQEQLNLIIENINTHKALISALDKELTDNNVVNSANIQTVETLRSERIKQDTQLASLLDNLSKVEAQFAEIDLQEKYILALNSKVSESERRTTTAHALRKSLQEELSKYTELSVEKSVISEEAQALLKPDPDIIINYHQHLEQRSEIAERIKTLDANAKDLSGQSADMFTLMSLAKSLLAKTQSSACPVCNAEYESHTALLEKIQSNGSIETALRSLLTSRSDLEKKIVQLDDSIERGHSYFISLKSSAVTNINERLSHAASELARLDQELEKTKYEQTTKSENLHRLKAEARNLSKSDYIIFVNDAISSVRAAIAKIDKDLEENVSSSEKIKQKNGSISLSKAKTLAKLEAAERNETYNTYRELKTKYMLQDGNIVDIFSPTYNELTDKQRNLEREISEASDVVTNLQNTLASSAEYSSEPPLLEKLVSLNEELRHVEEAITRIETFLIPIVNDFSAPTESLHNQLQLKKSELEKNNSTASASLMLINVTQAQIKDVLPFFKYRELRTKVESHKDTIRQIERLSISLDRELKKVEIKLKERIDSFFYTDLITAIYRKIDPHPFFKTVRFECIFPVEDKPRLEVYLYEDELSQPISPALYFSSAQLNILSLSIFLAKALHIEHDGEPVRAILIDDPIHSMDSINVLSVIDLLRNISIKFDRQIILSTHDENFYELLKLKVPEEQFGSKFIKFRSFGVVHADGNSD